MNKFDDEVKQIAFDMYGGFCQCNINCHKKVTEFHHKLSNTKGNRKKFPLFLQSIFNCCPINHDCHMTKPLPRVSEKEAVVYEWYLTRLLQSVGSDQASPSKHS